MLLINLFLLLHLSEKEGPEKKPVYITDEVFKYTSADYLKNLDFKGMR